MNKAEESKFFSSLDFECYLDKQAYYDFETAVISCGMVNSGNQVLKNLEVCFNNDCRETDLGINQEYSSEFSLALENLETQEIFVKVENEDMLKFSYLDLDIEDAPWHKRFWNSIKNLF